MKNNSRLSISKEGFTLSELLISVAIIGILGSLSIPQYFHQLQKTRQNEATAALSQIQTTIAAFVEEVGLLPQSWKDLNTVSPLMTPTGAANKPNFSAITLASSGCSTNNPLNCYQVEAKEEEYIFTLHAKPLNTDVATYNVLACLDLKTGASDIRKGNNKSKAKIEHLKCQNN